MPLRGCPIGCRLHQFRHRSFRACFPQGHPYLSKMLHLLASTSSLCEIFSSTAQKSYCRSVIAILPCCGRWLIENYEREPYTFTPQTALDLIMPRKLNPTTCTTTQSLHQSLRPPNSPILYMPPTPTSSRPFIKKKRRVKVYTACSRGAEGGYRAARNRARKPGPAFFQDSNYLGVWSLRYRYV